jgi:hypothetical protein
MGVFFLIVGLIGAVTGWWIHQRGAARSRTAKAWPTTTGTVISCEVIQVPVGSNTMLTPAVVYSYEVGGETLRGAALQLGAPPLFNSPAKAAALAARYPAGSRVTVHYEAAAPANAALSPKFSAGFGPLMAYSAGGVFLAGGVLILVMHL